MEQSQILEVSSKMNRKQILIIICVAILLSSYLLLLPFSKIEQTYAQSSWLTGWTYRKSHVIQNATGAGTDYQIPITVYKNAVGSTQWYIMSQPWVPVSGNSSLHGFDVAHTTDIVQCNIAVDGAVRTYLAYVTDAVSGYGGTGRVYLYYSNSLNDTWTPYSGNPIIGPSSNYYSTCSVALVNGTFQMFLGNGLGTIQRWTSTNGIDFTRVETVLSTSIGTVFNDPFIWLNPNDNYWYLFWSVGDGTDVYVYARNSTSITSFASASDVLVMQGASGNGNDGYGYPTVMYRDGKYWLLTENHISSWGVYAFWSNSVTSGYTQCDNNPIVTNNDACPRILIADDGVTCYLFYNEYVGSIWYQRAIQVYNTTYTNEVSTNGHCRDDFGDIRFSASDGVTPLNYWMENSFSESNATFWVQIPSDLSSNDQTIYVYYGNSSATTTSNGYNTFSYFEDFESGQIGNWNTYTAGTGTVIVSSTHAHGAYSLEAYKPSGAGNLAAVSLQISTTSLNQFKFGLKFYQQGSISTTDGYHLAAFEASQNAQNPAWTGAHVAHFSAGATIEYYSSGWRRTASQTTQDSWTSLLIKHKASTFTLIMNGGVIGTYDNLDSDGVRAVHLGTQVDTFGGSEVGYFDDLFLTKSVDPEPVNGTWGSEETAQLTPPTFGSINANTTIAGSPVQMSCSVNSTTNVSYYIYSWNNTGSWANETATPFTDFINSSAAYATFSSTWNTVAGNTVSVKIYANDTYNNWNASSQYDFVIMSASASGLVLTAGAGQSLVAGQLSGQMTVQRRDQYDNLVTSGSLTVNLTSTSLGAAFYSDAGGTTQVSSLVINDGSSSISFWYKDTAVGFPTLTVSTAGLASATSTFMIASASLNHFTITAISNPQTAGVTFNIVITAMDQYGNTVTSYTGSNTLSDLSGTISPTSTSSFSEGVWTGSVTITEAYYSDTISTFSSGKSGTTNSFDVYPGAFDHITMSGYPPSTVAGQSFNTTVTALDAFGNVVTGYAGQVYFTSSDGQAVLPYTIGSKYTFTSGDNGSRTFIGFELNTVPLQTITVTDGVKSATSNLIAVMLPITPPSYSSISVSSTFAGQPCTFYSGWNDNYGLSGYIFSTNNTGLWQNTTWTPFSGTPSWASVTQNLNSNIGAVIAYNWYANNTNGLWNNTGIQTLTTTDSALGLSFSVISNSTVSELAFNSTSQVLEFTVGGPSGTIGFTNVTIAKILIGDVNTLKVYIEGKETNYTINDLAYSWRIQFTYHHSSHKIVMDFDSVQPKASATPLNGVAVAIIGFVILIYTSVEIAITRKNQIFRIHKRKARACLAGTSAKVVFQLQFSTSGFYRPEHKPKILYVLKEKHVDRRCS